MKTAANAFRAYKPGKAARFDGASQHRRSLLAKVHLSAKELGQNEDDRRAVLLRITGQSSATDCTDSDLIRFLDEQKRLGWQAKPKATSGKTADHPAARKARALWISLYHLNAISNPSEKALEAFAKRQLKCERMQWADQGLMYKLIEALKAIGTRFGWDQTTANATDGSHALKILKMRLCDAILTKLKANGYAAEAWNLSGAAVQICGLEAARSSGPMGWSVEELDMVARSFGDLLRTGTRSESGSELGGPA
jgi:phage gp16-like protein